MTWRLRRPVSSPSQGSMPASLASSQAWHSVAVQIRPASPDDWPGIWPFWHKIALAGDTYFWDPATTRDEAERIWMEPPPGQVFVVEDGDAIVASAQLHPNYAPAS